MRRTLILFGVLFVLLALPVAPAIAQDFRRGDCNGDSGIDIGDAITVLGILFSGGAPPGCPDACDANDDGGNDIADAIALLASLFGSPTVPLPAPYPACGNDPTPDALGCASSPCPAAAIHVATTGNDANGGGPGDPLLTLPAALALLVGSPGISEIRMQNGVYTRSSDLFLPGGITIRGGYDGSWVQTGSAGTIIDLIGVLNPRIRIKNTSGLVLEYLRIDGTTPGLPGMSSNPVVVVDSDAEFRFCEFIAYAGNPGLGGAAGSPGTNGNGGGGGQSGCSGCSGFGGGGSGGVGVSGGGSGGNGGYDNASGQNGATGFGTRPSSQMVEKTTPGPGWPSLRTEVT